MESELRAVQLFDGVAPGVFRELVALFAICNPNPNPNPNPNSNPNPHPIALTRTRTRTRALN